MHPIVKRVSKVGAESCDLYSYQFQECREIWLTGEINGETARSMISQIKYLDGSGNGEITLYINSPGGCVSDGLAIIDAMKACRCEIKTIATGMAASMAALILSCGDHRMATPLTDIMIHQPLGAVQGQVSDILLATQHFTKTREKLNRILADATGQTPETIAAFSDRDYHMDAEQAKKFGLIDAVFTGRDD